METDEDFASIRDVLSISDMVSNNVQYLLKHKRPSVPDGKWGTVKALGNGEETASETSEEMLPGVFSPVLRKSRKTTTTVPYNSIPPSVRNVYTALRDNDVFSTTGPLLNVAPEYRFTALGDAWKQCIETVTVHTMTTATTAAAARKINMLIPVSPAEHDQEQLRIGRRSTKTGHVLGTCSEGQNCEALVFKGNTRPLHPYLTPSQERLFHTKGVGMEGPCLLCIRKTVTSVSMMYQKDWLGVAPHNQLPMQVPFYNTVNEPGGYNAEDMIMPNYIMFMPGPVAAYNPGKLEFVPTEIGEGGVQEGYINQGAIMFQSGATSASN